MKPSFVRSRHAILRLLAAGTCIVSCSRDLATGPGTLSTNSSDATAFHPASSVTLGPGSYEWTDVVIPAGVTVTVTGNVAIRTAGDFTVQ